MFLSPPSVGRRERDLITEALDSGYVAPAGPMLQRFEEAFAAYVGLPHAVAVSSGTAALHLALSILRLDVGDAVIVPTLTFIGGVAPVNYLRATPIFVDCDETSWCLDPALLRRSFDLAASRSLRVKAVVPTDLYGQACDVDAIAAICAEYETPLVIDSAEAVGARYKQRHAGDGGLAAAFSFNGNKIITTSGGGMLASHDRSLIERARYLSTAARQPTAHFEHTEIGFNYRLSNISAAIGLAQLEDIEARVAHRRWLFSQYERSLANVAGLSFAPEAPERRHTHWLTVILIDPAEFGATPEDIRNALEAQNIEARPLWKPMHLQPVFEGALRVGGEVAESLYGRGLCLPSGPDMTAADVARVCEVILKLAGGGRRRQGARR